MMAFKCLLCVAEHKLNKADLTVEEAVEVRDAITICTTPMSPVTPICYEHIEVQRQSSLLTPAGPPQGMPQIQL